MLEYLFWPQKWIPHAKLPINRHTTCKKCTKMTHNVMVGKYDGQNAPMFNLTSEMNSLSQFCYSLMYLMLHLFWLLGQTLQIRIQRYFFYCVRARTFKAFQVNFLSAYLFQECQDICSSAINEVNIDLLSKKSHFFTKSARARTFAQIRSKPKNACNIHNSEFACKKSASYDKLCLTTV